MANIKLRDRDAIQTEEGIIFRVFGYSHPHHAFICDAEYASQNIFKSNDPRAPRTSPNQTFYKFYDDEGQKLIFNKFKKYIIYHKMLKQNVVGINETDIAQVRKPEERLQTLIKDPPKDHLLAAMQQVLKIATEKTGLETKDFGVFGSMLHGFHHPNLSDIDFLVYGKNENFKVGKSLEQLYKDNHSGFNNEFKSEKVMEGKKWRFKNFTVKDFVWHQSRKQIYGLYHDKASGRTIKTEFEPVKAWNEIKSEYKSQSAVEKKGWVKLRARVINDEEAPFIPSIYDIEPLEVISGEKSALDVRRVFSYMEEFRLQAQRDEEIIVEGNLEEVISPSKSLCQVTLTYCPRYYEQVLKALH